MSNIYKFNAAKGNCYAAAFALCQMHRFRMTDQIFLCHGIVTQTKQPHERMGHAWIEEYVTNNVAMGGYVWVVRDGLYPTTRIFREDYYKMGEIDSNLVKRYAWTQARNLREVHQNFGPWDEVILSAAHAETK